MPIGEIDDPLGGYDVPSGILGNIIFEVGAVVGGIIAAVTSSAIAIKQGLASHAWHQTPNNLVPPDQAAVLSIKDPGSYGEYQSEAQYSGISPARFAALHLLAEQAPDISTLTSLWRLGRIDDGQFTLGLRQAQMPDVWIDAIRLLRFIPLAPTSYLQGAVQNHYDHDAAIEQATLQGVTAADAEMVFQTLGDPPGVMQMLELKNRGVLTEDETVQGIRESRIKDKYIDAVLQLGVYIPPVRTVTALLRAGAVTEAEARQLYAYDGVQPDVINAYVANATHGKVASHKQASVGKVTQAYTDHLIDRTRAEAWLLQIGYLQNDADLVLDLATLEAAQKLRASTIKKVENLFIGKHIDEATARQDLATLQVDLGQIDALISIWKIGQTTPTKELTLPQLTAMAKAGVIALDEWTPRVEALGYSPADTALLAALDFPAPVGG